MPGQRKKIPHNDDPGYLYGEECQTIPGFIILVDSRKTEIDVEAETNWVLIHVPSYLAWSLDTRRDARSTLEDQARFGGEFTEWVVDETSSAPSEASPSDEEDTFEGSEGFEDGVPAPEEEENNENSTSRDGSAHARTRAEPRKRGFLTTIKGPVVEGPVENPRMEVMDAEGELALDPQAMNDALVSDLETRFPNSRLLDVLDGMLEAHRVYVKKGSNGSPDEIVRAPDFNAQLKGVEAIWKYKIGNPIQRMEVKAKADMTMDDLEEMARRSPAFKRSLQQLLARIG